MESVAFIKNQDIGQVLSKGLAVLYENKPDKPIDYLARWLLNHSDMTKKKQQLIKNLQDDESSLGRFMEVQNYKDQQENERISQEKAQIEQEQEMIKSLHAHEYLPEELNDLIPNYIQKMINATGVYLSEFDHPKLEISDQDDAEYAHLDKSSKKCLQYIGCSKGHEFILKEQILPNSLTHKFFDQNQTNNQQESMYIMDAAHETNLHFYKIPKLGSYFALLIDFKDFLSVSIFDQAVEQRLEYIKNVEAHKEEKETLIQTQQTKREALDPEVDDFEVFEQTCKEELENLVMPEIPQFPNENQYYMIGMDTLGQDREISLKERDQIKSFFKDLQNAWEKTQKGILENDVQNYVKNQSAQSVFPEFQVPDESNEADSVHEKFEYFRAQLKSEDMTQQLKNLSQYRVLKFGRIVQGNLFNLAILYLLGYKKQDINLPGTNLLNWKKISKEIICQPEFLEKLYDKHYKSFSKLEIKNLMWSNTMQKQINLKKNKMIFNIQKITIRALVCFINGSNFTLSQELTIFKNEKSKNKLREKLQKIQLQEDRNVRRNNALQAHKSNLSPQDLETFNEEAWDQEFSIQMPTVVVPDEIESDCDLDFDQEQPEEE